MNHVVRVRMEKRAELCSIFIPLASQVFSWTSFTMMIHLVSTKTAFLPVTIPSISSIWTYYCCYIYCCASVLFLLASLVAPEAANFRFPSWPRAPLWVGRWCPANSRPLHVAGAPSVSTAWREPWVKTVSGWHQPIKHKKTWWKLWVKTAEK